MACPVRSAGRVQLISLSQAVSPQVDKPLKSVMHGHWDARPTVTFPAAGHHRLLTGTKLYCLVTYHACANNLPKVVAWKCEAGSRTRDFRSSESNALNNYATGAWKLCILKSTLFSDKQWTKAAKISDICLTERHGGHSALTDVQKIV